MKRLILVSIFSLFLLVPLTADNHNDYQKDGISRGQEITVITSLDLNNKKFSGKVVTVRDDYLVLVNARHYIFIRFEDVSCIFIEK